MGDIVGIFRISRLKLKFECHRAGVGVGVGAGVVDNWTEGVLDFYNDCYSVYFSTLMCSGNFLGL